MLSNMMDDAAKRIKEWNEYVVYLLQWSIDHGSPYFAGMSPAGFDEWRDNDYREMMEAQ